MSIIKKTIIASLILCLLILLLFFGAVNTIYSQIIKESQNFVDQKKELLEAEAKVKNLHDFKANFKQYQPNFEKIDNLFIDAAEPIDFIEFLELMASESGLSIDISPPVSKDKGDDFWQFLEFNLNIKGTYPNLAKFLEKLESADYLIRFANLTVNNDSEEKNSITAILSIKVYSK